MRTITKYSKHVYTSKASAKRAALNAVGSTYLVEEPELRNRFDGELTIGMDMLSVETCGNGWKWSYTFNLADVVVKAHYADGVVADVRYAEVAHWRDATTPPQKPVHAAANQVNAYMRARDAAENDGERFALYDSTVPGLLIACEGVGINYGDVFAVCRAVQDAMSSSSPDYIAEVIVRAEPYGLASAALRAHLGLWAVRRGVKPAVYLDYARERLSTKAA